VINCCGIFAIPVGLTDEKLRQITKERRIRNTDSGPNTRDVALKQQISSVSPCGQLGILNINFRAALTDGSGASFGGYNPDAPVTDELAFAWKQC
jgi:hypothetical protein